MHITQVMGGVHLHVLMCRCAPFTYLGNGWIDCVEIWCVVRDTLARLLQKSRMGYICKCARAHVQTCPFFRISEMAGRIALKLYMSLENRQLGILQKCRVGYSCTYARVHPLSYLEKARRIALIFGMLLENH